MMPRDEFNLDKLIVKCLDGTISDGELEQLNQELMVNPEACKIYADTIFINSQISSPGNIGTYVIESQMPPLDSSFDYELWSTMADYEKKAPAIELPKKESRRELIQKVVYPPREKRPISKLTVATFIVSAAAILMLAAFIYLTPVETFRPVAFLSDSIDAKWATNGDIAAEGEYFGRGVLTLTGGFAEITFNCGAKVIVEGPAEFELESEEVLYLQKGKLSCNVPPEAIGFTVGTPKATVVDYGTDFGVIVHDTGRTEAHVFKGEVELRTGPDRLVFNDSRRLTGSQASIIDENEKLLPRRFRSRPNHFVRNELVPYEIVVRNSRPFTYWRFDAADREVFHDTFGRAQQTCEFHGDITIVPGPSLGKGKVGNAIQLNGDGSYVYAPKVGDRDPQKRRCNRDYSYSFWVRPNGVAAQDLITVTNTGAVQYRHIGLDKNGRFSFFTHRFLRGTKKGVFSGDVMFQPGRWYHVVVTSKQLDPERAEMYLYVNGRPDASKVVTGTFSPQFFGHFYVGAVPEEAKVEGVGTFDGAIAEIVEYERALTPGEVQAIYSSVE